MTSKFLALTDARGKLIYSCLLPRQAHDLRGTAALIAELRCGQLLPDWAFDADWPRDASSGVGIEVAIPPGPITAARNLQADT